MKKILLGLILCASSCFAIDPPFPNNAYVFFDKYEGKLSMGVIYENHFYVAQMPMHHPACHCQQPEVVDLSNSPSLYVWEHTELPEQE